MTASFNPEVILTHASDDLKSNVLSPRPVTLVLKRPLCAIEDSVCVELSLMVQEAISRIPSLCNSIFETLLRNSESMLLVQKKSYQSFASLERKFVGIINLGCTCYFRFPSSLRLCMRICTTSPKTPLVFVFQHT